MVKLASTAGILIFTLWGLGPVVHLSHNLFWNKNNNNVKKSGKYHATTSYNLQRSCFSRAGGTIVCRALELVVPPVGMGQFVVNFLNFYGSVLALVALIFRLLSLDQQIQENMETDDVFNTRKMRSGIVGRAMATIAWSVALTVYMELLGYWIPKMLGARMLVLILFVFAGLEIFMNAHESSMNNATQPFAVKKGILTIIEGYEVPWEAKTGCSFPGGVVFVVVLAAVYGISH
ncbi:mechanosensitive ion channel protein 2, chloroplastic-like [Henckelia pumila]|uniref:mechanosensitive ion channel protein 2, chloroplastic-like n=1 Tax=Henckelia pumila TaxID=405737 RepID=UPI003C6E8F4C